MNIHFLQPFDFEINIGRGYNRALALLPDEDFVCITDHDTLKFKDFAKILRMVLEEHQDKWDDLFTCTTNRLRMPNPQVVAELFNEHNIDAHAHYAEWAWEYHGSKLREVRLAAGVMLCAKVSQLRKLGGFNEGTIVFDRMLSDKFIRAGKRVYLIQGLYLFHLYRWGVENPENHYEHLLKKNN